jgi:parallel beta-helix repeat protein
MANIASALGGGGIYIYYNSNPLVEQNLITQNSSSNGAGIGIYWNSNPVIRNNLIANNLLGAGIRIVSLAPIITNNTISFNGLSGIQYEPTASPIITNNIITSNGLGKGINASSTTGTIRYNNVWGHSAGNYSSLIGDLTGINDNISQNPLFAGVENCHILPDSPCVNTGDSNAASGEFDFDNEERIFNSRIDIGADECVTNTSDFNNDGIVDFEDLFEFSENWLTVAGDSPADFVDDNFINFADFAIFAENWLWTARWR